MRLIIIAIAILVFSSCEKSTQTNNQVDLLNVDLSGQWDGYGYVCTGLQDLEIVEITHEGTSVTAIKTIGDDCVTKGHPTFYGEYTQNPFYVTIVLGSVVSPNSSSIQNAEMELITPDLLISNTLDVFFVRKKTYYP